ncbi:MdtA/MuxA family multidrug efflux RND transporter periplasmic adaptor subunit [Flavisphingomonas formosensis]|uniref:MdtA/MuxA family multidrug efflux RND transporter periplasmic adaptor subunit n=1 Tax=Flavisphingomonas formosensis TaxID=861534 RepID=UPI0012F9FC4A|nr:MdtA/MuxA family multidrug efflux RND transporter periplasmic adaptor subunit [Sphingomonas formosensis]
MDELELDQSRRRRKNFVIAAVVLVFVGLVAWYLTSGSSDGAGGGGPGGRGGRGRPAATVGTAKAAALEMPVTLAAIGTVQPITTATVRPQLSGVLFSIHFTEGQMVTKGQLLAQIDPRPYRLALAQAEANLARDDAQLNLARTDLKRYQTLLKQDSIASQQVDTQAATVKQLEGTVGADRAAIGTARLNLAYTAITAPVSGRVGLRQADIGNYLTPSDTNGIVVITQTTPIDVSFAVPQDKLPTVQAKAATSDGLSVSAYDQSGVTLLSQGRFLTFDNQIDATTGTVKAKARFPNPDGKLFPNQFVNVNILVDTLRNAVAIPVTAVRHGAQGDFVFLLQPDKTVKLQTVKTGPANEKNIVILSGVALGQTVITEGADNLDDGSRVQLPGDAPRSGRGNRSSGGLFGWLFGSGSDNGGGSGRHRRGEGAAGGDNGSTPADGNQSGERQQHRRRHNADGGAQ